MLREAASELRCNRQKDKAAGGGGAPAGDDEVHKETKHEGNDHAKHNDRALRCRRTRGQIFVLDGDREHQSALTVSRRRCWCDSIRLKEISFPLLAW